MNEDSFILHRVNYILNGEHSVRCYSKEDALQIVEILNSNGIEARYLTGEK